MLTRLQDQGTGLFVGQIGDLGELVDSQDRRGRHGCEYLPSANLEISSGVKPSSPLRFSDKVSNVFLPWRFHGQQSIFSAGTQLIDRVFVKRSDSPVFPLQRHVGHFFQAGKTFSDQDVGNFFVHIELVDEQLTDGVGLDSLLLGRFPAAVMILMRQPVRSDARRTF